jgi:hypothetical protein
MWTYYQEMMPSGDYRLYRVDETREAQSFNRVMGWISTGNFFRKLRNGDLDFSDIVDEARALALARACAIAPDPSSVASASGPTSDANAPVPAETEAGEEARPAIRELSAARGQA